MTSLALEKFKKDFQGKKILIMGLGLLGKGVADAEVFSSIGAKVTVTDLKPAILLKPSLKKLKKYPIKYVLGKHEENDFIENELIIRNPDVAWDSPYLNLARKHHKAIFMDETLFFQYAKVNFIGVTGTRGKSTTSALIYEILKKAQKQVYLAGNVKDTAALPLLRKIKKDDWLILELSSWQLQGFREIKLSPYISVLTNIYEDHLNRYPSMAAYVNDKTNIFRFQKATDHLLINLKLSSAYKNIFKTQAKVSYFGADQLPETLKAKLKLKGEHNWENVSAALQVAKVIGIDKKISHQAVMAYKGLAYRQEKICEINGVKYINDTTSTTPIAGIQALTNFPKPLLLICGGSSKNLSLDDFAKNIVKKTTKIVLLKGTATPELKALIEKYGGKEKITGEFSSLKAAICVVKKLVKPGYTVLFSPGCASFGMFKNEFDRGDQFNQLILMK